MAALPLGKDELKIEKKKEKTPSYVESYLRFNLALDKLHVEGYWLGSIPRCAQRREEEDDEPVKGYGDDEEDEEKKEKLSPKTEHLLTAIASRLDQDKEHLVFGVASEIDCSRDNMFVIDQRVRILTAELKSGAECIPTPFGRRQLDRLLCFASHHLFDGRKLKAKIGTLDVLSGDAKDQLPGVRPNALRKATCIITLPYSFTGGELVVGSPCKDVHDHAEKRMFGGSDEAWEFGLELIKQERHHGFLFKRIVDVGTADCGHRLSLADGRIRCRECKFECRGAVSKVEGETIEEQTKRVATLVKESGHYEEEEDPEGGCGSFEVDASSTTTICHTAVFLEGCPYKVAPVTKGVRVSVSIDLEFDDDNFYSYAEQQSALRSTSSHAKFYKDTVNATQKEIARVLGRQPRLSELISDYFAASKTNDIGLLVAADTDLSSDHCKRLLARLSGLNCKVVPVVTRENFDEHSGSNLPVDINFNVYRFTEKDVNGDGYLSKEQKGRSDKRLFVGNKWQVLRSVETEHLEGEDGEEDARQNRARDNFYFSTAILVSLAKEGEEKEKKEEDKGEAEEKKTTSKRKGDGAASKSKKIKA